MTRDPSDPNAILESLSAELMLADLDDLPSLARLLKPLEACASWLEANQYSSAQSARNALLVLENLIIQQPPDKLDQWLRLESALTGLLDNLRLQLRGNGAPAGSVLENEIGMDPILAEFLSGQAVLTEEWESYCLTMDNCQKQPGGSALQDERLSSEFQEAVAALRRLLHNLKGEAGLLGLERLEALCHGCESALEQAQEKAPVDLLLEAKDWVSRELGALSSAPAAADSSGILEIPESPDDLLSRLAKAHLAPPFPIQSVHLESNSTTFKASIGAEHLNDPSLMRDFLSESKEHLERVEAALLRPEALAGDQESLHEIFRSFHSIKGLAGFLDLNEIQKVSHAAEYLLDAVRQSQGGMNGPTSDLVFDSVDMLKRLMAAVQSELEGAGPCASPEGIELLLERLRRQESECLSHLPAESGKDAPRAERKLGEILVERGTVSEAELSKILEAQQGAEDGAAPRALLGELLVREGKVPAREVAQALRIQQGEPGQVRENVKVDAERLDRLLDAIGELVIAESMVVASPEMRELAGSGLQRRLGHLDRITRELQEIGMSLRMVPVRSTFQRMARVVRDLSRKCGKPVDFSTEGEDTELDRSVVERIADPLVHMVRNSVDHGLENPVERKATGKSATGKVVLRAFHRGGNIVIEVEDDGKGLDREILLHKALTKGLAREGAEYTDKEVFGFIFEPGFSTAAAITEISGRGVGLDVVKRNVQALRGNIEIRSKKGEGTVFQIRLPLTLAIIDAMCVRCGSERYLFPTLSIVRTIRPEPGMLIRRPDGGEVLRQKDNLLPLLRLGELFGLSGFETDPANALVIIVEEGGRRFGILADELLSQQQIVIKTLGEYLKGLPGLTGGCVLSDGSVGLVLDIAGLAGLAGKLESSFTEKHQS